MSHIGYTNSLLSTAVLKPVGLLPLSKNTLFSPVSEKMSDLIGTDGTLNVN